MKRSLTLIFFVCCIFMSPLALLAQDVTATGKVTDKSDGKPLPGVTVTLQGTTKATLTDASGNFRIAVPSVGAKLVISQLGMIPQTITITNNAPVNIALEADVTALGEVVVVGYGTQKKSNVTDSISSVKAKDLESMPINRVEQALQGRTSGVTIATNNGQPGSAATVRVRGYTTFAKDGNNNPLCTITNYYNLS